MNMQAYALTDRGRLRSMNQDYIYSSPEPVGALPNLFMVADGMGGHRAGDYASRFTIEQMAMYLGRSREGAPVALLKEAISRVNLALFEEAATREDYYGMGCTLVAAVACEDTLYVANIGDSRLYHFSGGNLLQVTRDHSYVEEMVSAGLMLRGSALYRKKKNLITRAMGIERWITPDFFEVDLAEEDLFLLCSDGLTNMVPDTQIRGILAGPGSLKEKCRGLIRLANEAGGTDNIAVVLAAPAKGGEGIC